MTGLEAISRSGLLVDWDTLLAGWDGPGKFGRQVTAEEIIDLAVARLSDGATAEAVVTLAGASPCDTEEIDGALRKLATGDRATADLAERKWRLVLLEHCLSRLPDDPLYGLIGMTEFWEKFDYPDDGPHSVQGRDDDRQPRDYFTDENFASARHSHMEWIAQERRLLLPAESSVDPSPKET